MWPPSITFLVHVLQTNGTSVSSVAFHLASANKASMSFQSCACVIICKDDVHAPLKMGSKNSTSSKFAVLLTQCYVALFSV